MCVRFQRKTISGRLSFNICLYILYLLIKYYLIYLRTHNIIYAASFDYTSLSRELRNNNKKKRNEKFIKQKKSLSTERNEMSFSCLL